MRSQDNKRKNKRTHDAAAILIEATRVGRGTLAKASYTKLEMADTRPLQRPRSLQSLDQRRAQTAVNGTITPLSNIEDTGLTKLAWRSCAEAPLLGGDLIGSDISERIRLPYAGVIDGVLEFSGAKSTLKSKARRRVIHERPIATHLRQRHREGTGSACAVANMRARHRFLWKPISFSCRANKDAALSRRMSCAA